MNTLQPPVRSSFYATAQIIHKKSDNNKKDNFIFFNRKSKYMEYIVNSDKLKKSYVYSQDEMKHIEIEDLFLKNLIQYSVKKFPRKYLFQVKYRINQKVSTSNVLLNWLQVYTDLQGLTINMMRSSYINWFYRRNLDMASKTALAHKMLHSVDAGETYYFKVDAGET